MHAIPKRKRERSLVSLGSRLSRTTLKKPSGRKEGQRRGEGGTETPKEAEDSPRGEGPVEAGHGGAGVDGRFERVRPGEGPLRLVVQEVAGGGQVRALVVGVVHARAQDGAGGAPHTCP